MTAVILTLHSLIVLALIGVVLLQRSDGGALGLGGGGGGGGGFMTGRGAANALTRTTSVLAALFFATSLVLAIRAGGGETIDDVADELIGGTTTEQSAPADITGAPSAADLLESLGPSGETTDTAPESASDLIEDLGGEAPLAQEPATAPEGDETTEDTQNPQ